MNRASKTYGLTKAQGGGVLHPLIWVG